MSRFRRNQTPRIPKQSWLISLAHPAAFLEETITTPSIRHKKAEMLHIFLHAEKKKRWAPRMEMSSQVLLLFLYLNSGFWSRWWNLIRPLSHATGSGVIFRQLIESATRLGPDNQRDWCWAWRECTAHVMYAATIVTRKEGFGERGSVFQKTVWQRRKGNRRWFVESVDSNIQLQHFFVWLTGNLAQTHVVQALRKCVSHTFLNP